VDVGVIINPNSKKNRLMQENPLDVYNKISNGFADVRLTKNVDEIEAVLDDFHKNGIKYLCLSGGDGTLHHAITRYVHKYGLENVPPVLILKGGTMDNVSRSFDLNGVGPDIFKRFLNALQNSEEIKLSRRDMMKVDDKYCFLFGIGLVANFLDEAYSGKEKGLVQNLKVIGKALKEWVVPPARGGMLAAIKTDVLVDGEKLSFSEISALLSGTVEQIGMGFSPLSRGNEKIGTFHSIISGISLGKLFANILKLKNGEKIKSDVHYDDIMKKIELISDEKYRYTLDGDMYENTKKNLIVEIDGFIDFIVV